MLKLKHLTLAICTAISIGTIALPTSAANELNTHQVAQAQSFLTTYAKLADLSYTAALKDAKALQQAINQFVKNPTATTLAAAKQAWLNSRESYGQTEIFRLSQGPIDAEEGWVEAKYGNKEGQINAWPLDENLIDYTIDAEGKRTSGNIIDSTGDFNPGGENPTAVNVDQITPEVITELNENGGEANVASGYHAIEFLLWGQDQDYNNFLEDNITHGPMTAGQRPLSDFTTDKFAKRRLAYLKAATDKLVDDLQVVYSAWTPTGEYRQALTGKLTGKQAKDNIPTGSALKDIFIGMGMFIKSELANERIAVAVLTPSEEDEHSCFSDNTHRDIAQNFLGFENVLLGKYNGKKIGIAPIDQLNAKDKTEIEKMLKSINTRIAKINHLAQTTMHFDYQIRPENKEAVQNIVSLKNELRRLGDKMVIVAKAYGITLTTDDVTDSEENHDYEK
ncbi:imelysin [Mergibacter septicus]|uniref:imelysin family protein n=1 Tax=Mergibacter septicus TaxID=221402 RepID=UPI001C78C64E|nr:imelysin family protein [Mergibacter septicus]QDJ13246.1 imelysin [Mergibacter septicus]